MEVGAEQLQRERLLRAVARRRSWRSALGVPGGCGVVRRVRLAVRSADEQRRRVVEHGPLDRRQREQRRAHDGVWAACGHRVALPARALLAPVAAP